MARITNYNLYLSTQDDKVLYKVIADGQVCDEESLEAKVCLIRSLLAMGINPIVSVFIPRARWLTPEEDMSDRWPKSSHHKGAKVFQLSDGA